MSYGIANQTGMPSEQAATSMLDAACDAGVTVFDTARSYGISEQRVGAALSNRDLSHITLITKLSPLGEIPENENPDAVMAKVDESIHTSLQYLGLKCLPYLKLHRAAHLHAFNGAIWQQLLKLRKQGLIERLGVSVASVQETLDALSFPGVECLQIPYNILDWRWEDAGIPAILLKRPEILVLSRSALLQGLLTQEPAKWPVIPQAESEKVTRLLDGWVTQFKRKHCADLCLAFVRGQPWIDSVIVGMETMQQLRENLELFQTPPLSPDESAIITRELPKLPESLLNPALWPKSK